MRKSLMAASAALIASPAMASGVPTSVQLATSPTGTPPGVGIARKPTPVLLKPGDVVEVEIEKIGVLRNPCVAE